VLEHAAQAAGFELEITDNPVVALASVCRLTPSALLVDSTARGAGELCQRARFGGIGGELCLLVGAHKITEAVFAKAVQWGADDAVNLTIEPLTRRLVRLPSEHAEPAKARGTAVVACPDAARAARIGHVLGFAGYKVELATELDSALGQALSERVALAVVSTHFGRPRDLVGSARESGSEACFVFLARPSEFTRELHATRTLDRVAIIRDDEPPEAALFVHNELLSPEADHGRRESRLLHGTLVAFRAAGEGEDDFGFTYNVSPNGLYVRTLATPAEDHVWLELCPPSSDRRVRLEGHIAWRCGFGSLGTATAPPGFGVRLSGGLGSDHTRWVQGYRALLEQADAVATIRDVLTTSPSAEIARKAKPSPSGVAARGVSDSPESIPAESSAKPRARAQAFGGEADLAELVRITLTDEEIRPWLDARAVADPATPLDPIALTDFSPSLDESDLVISDQPSARPSLRPRWVRDGWVVSGGLAFLLAAGIYLNHWLGTRPDHSLGPSTTQQNPVDSETSGPSQRLVTLPQTGPVSSSLPSAPSPLSGAPRAAESQSAPPAPQEAETPPAPVASADGSGLPPKRGYLWVRSSAQSVVFVNGISTGATNSRLEVPCGWRFVRLGREPGPTWLSPGQTVDVTCQGFTTVTIQP
jgi:hypothetical protein